MYTDEQQRIIDRLNEFIGEQPSQNEAAKLLGISAPILTNLRKGTYTGTVDKFMNKLAAYFNIKSDLGNTYREIEYAHTSISKKVYDTIRICHVKGGLAVYAGDAGIGKTKAAQKYVGDNPDSAVYLSVNPCLTSIKSTLKLLASKLGASTASTLDELWSNIIGKLSDGMVLIFDEAQHLPIKTIETLRSFSDYFRDSGQTLGIIFIGNRFWADDCLGHNAESIFLGACWKILRADYPHIKAVQSFADGRLGCGTIYKATNFKYFGFHKSLFYENIFTGEVQHKIPMEDASTMKMAHLNRLWCEGKFKPFIVNTYRYIYPLQNIKFKIKEKPYPEYSKGKQYLSNYHHNTRLIYRALCIAYISDMNDDFLVLKEWIEKNQTPEQIQSLMKIALDNKFILIRAQNNSVQYKIDELKKLFQQN